MGEKWEDYTVNNGSIHGGMVDTQGGITGGITGTEICHRTV